ncbi:MAG: hypothetical protein D3903_13355 [Candidatus Electrothrix sp. GM3_4]|nr:hypothetical protein [Candidatus Electrothrix sp. GM3_4]
MGRKERHRKKSNRKFLPYLLTVPLLFFVSGAALAGVDSFTTAQPELIVDSNSSALSGSVGNGSDTTILGGARDYSLNFISGPTKAKMILIDSVGYISMSVDALSTATATIQWDGADGTIALDHTGLQSGGLGVDLTNSETFDAFAITTISVDHPTEFVIGVYTDSTHWTEISYTVDVTYVTETDFYSLADFSNPSLCNTTNPAPGINSVTCAAQPADVTNVGAVQFLVDPDGKISALDWLIDNIDLVSTATCFGTIGNVVWNDLNRDGIQDAGEPGINGVTVSLKNSDGIVIGTKVTSTVNGVPGVYQFKHNCAGDYTVEVAESTLPPDLVPSSSNQGNDPAVDSNGTPATVNLPTDNDSDLTIDFGYNSPCIGSIGNFIWFDENRNGIQDAGEAGIQGVTVNLEDTQGAVIATTTTNANGYYEFPGLCANDYRVLVVTLPAGYVDNVASPTLEGIDRTIDSNKNGTIVTLSNDSAEDMTIDFGYNSPCTGRMGDYVWNDVNRNGIQDVGEAGIEGIIVNLKDTRNIVIGTTTTDANGNYEFPGLCAGDYRIEVDEFTLPSNMVSSPTLEGSDPTVDSNVNSTTVTLTNDSAEDMTIDFGYNSPCTGRMGDYVWNDVNRNGIQDAGENGIESITVNLKDSQNTVLATVTTDVDGLYEFNGLCANTYKVEVDESTLPPSMVSSPTLEGSDPYHPSLFI